MPKNGEMLNFKIWVLRDPFNQITLSSKPLGHALVPLTISIKCHLPLSCGMEIFLT